MNNKEITEVIVEQPSPATEGNYGPCMWVCGVVVLLFVIAAVFTPASKCGVCGALLKKSRYRWKVDGRKVTTCANCNSRLAKKQSSAALKKRGLW